MLHVENRQVREMANDGMAGDGKRYENHTCDSIYSIKATVGHWLIFIRRKGSQQLPINSQKHPKGLPLLENVGDRANWGRMEG